MVMVERIDPQLSSVSLADQMSRCLGEAIVKEELHEKGCYITEAELAKRYGTSRIVIREAVKILLGKGLIHSRQRRGIQATERHSWNLFDNDILEWMMQFCDTRELQREIAQMRLAIEPEAASMAARFASDVEIKSIEPFVQCMEETVNDRRVFEAADANFHLAIISICKNRFYLNFSNVLKKTLHYNVSYTHGIRETSSFFQRALEHKRVYEKILARDAEGAWDTMRTMLQNDLDRMGQTKKA